MRNRTLALLIAVSLATATVATAATDGSLGTTSTGSSDISIEIPAYVRATGFANFSFGTWSGSGNFDSNDNVCIYSNSTGGGYQVTATGEGAGGAFTLSNGSGGELDYEVWWNDAANTTGSVQVTAGVALTGQTGAHTTSQTCGGGNRANLRIRILSTALSTSNSGAYSGTVTIVIEGA